MLGQNFILPNLVADSAYFEIVRGRACEKVANKQAFEILTIQTELLTQGKIIQLKKSEVTHLEEIISAMQRDFTAVKTIKDEKIHSLKVKLRKITIMLIGETGLIIVLIVLLL